MADATMISNGLIHEVVVTATRAGFEQRDFDALAKSEEKCRKVLSLLRGTSALASPTIYTITRGDGRSGSDLLAAGKYGKVWDYARKFIESKDFPISKTAEEVDFEMVEFDHDPMAQEVFDEFARRGLERPLPEDALRFGEKFPDLQRERPIVFLHEPWRDPDGYRLVLCLGRWRGKRGLGTGMFGSRWPRYCLFPGRRPRK